MSEWEDLYRWCVYCQADCWVDEPEHAADCPSNTGIWPVRERDGALCPHCGKDTLLPIHCIDCGAELNVGDHYAMRDSETGEQVVKPDAGGIGEVICLGCAARLGLAV